MLHHEYGARSNFPQPPPPLPLQSHVVVGYLPEWRRNVEQVTVWLAAIVPKLVTCFLSFGSGLKTTLGPTTFAFTIQKFRV